MKSALDPEVLPGSFDPAGLPTTCAKERLFRQPNGIIQYRPRTGSGKHHHAGNTFASPVTDEVNVRNHRGPDRDDQSPFNQMRLRPARPDLAMAPRPAAVHLTSSGMVGEIHLRPPI